MTVGYDTVGDARDALSKGYPTAPSVEEVISATSTDGLLTAFASLTHRIHTCSHDKGSLAADLYEQRDLIKAEILRRTGEA